MAVTDDVESATTARMNHVRDSYERDVAASAENVRWLTTLVLAAMGGIAAYRTSGDNPPGLGPAYATLLVLFGLALAAFVVSVVKSRFERAEFADSFQRAVVALATRFAVLKGDQSKAPADGTKELITFREAQIAELPSSFGRAATLEMAGLGLLALSGTLAALMVFFSELVASLFG